jgi:hypothetical protein
MDAAETRQLHKRIIGKVIQATATHSISISNSIGQEATGTKVREAGFPERSEHRRD